MTFREFVALVAAMMAINALSIDMMLPALPDIGASLGLTGENERQWIITAYLLGFGAAQIVYGPLADRFGRKPVLLVGVALYTLFTVVAAFAPTFQTIVIARILQGIGAASTRVLAVAIVRDSYSGRTMARVMSLAFIVFLVAPIVAPTIGQGIVLVAPWHAIFWALAAVGVVLAIWIALRLPETLHAEDRKPVSVASVVSAFKLALTTRVAVGYMLASTATFGALFGFVASSQQVFTDALGQPAWFTTAFAVVAGTMAISSFVNSRIVEQAGTRRVSHAGLLGFIAFAVVHAIVAYSGNETIWTFIVLQSGMMFCFGLVASNFGAMAMEPLGHIAGTGSSVQGFFTTVGGALIGSLIGQLFDGTTVPLTIGFVACGLVSLALVLWTEKGRLFHPTHPAPAHP
ncbi:MAG: multidrug effflux MFS transporter [Bauldia sp.]|nr:multidrug effflux MFS transporter [Bauldia sp.]